MIVFLETRLCVSAPVLRLAFAFVAAKTQAVR